MFSQQLVTILLGPAFVFLLITLFWNQISIGFLEQIRSPRLRLRRLNINHLVAILASLFYAWFIFLGWRENRRVLTPFDQYLLLTVTIVLFSGLFSFTIYLLYGNDRNSFLPKPDIYEVYREREANRAGAMLEEAQTRARILSAEISLLRDDWRPGSPYKLNPGYVSFKKAFKPHGDMAIDDYIAIGLPSGNALIFETYTIISTKGEANYYYVLHYDYRKAAESPNKADIPLYVSTEKPQQRQVRKFVELRDVGNSDPVEFRQFLNQLYVQEQGIAEEIRKQKTSNTILPLGVIWYYVIMLMIGNKIDYLIPVTRLAKTLILILSLCRFLFLGSFLSILMK